MYEFCILILNVSTYNIITNSIYNFEAQKEIKKEYFVFIITSITFLCSFNILIYEYMNYSEFLIVTDKSVVP